MLFCDLVGSTATAETVDPEAMRAAMDAYYDACRNSIEKHQGVVEKFIGDAVMAVFGADGSHEDDALRAVRAARDIIDTLAALNAGLDRDLGFVLRVRCGICSGEAVVVARSPAAGARIVGDVVNTAARLESAAGTGEIIIGVDTLQLCGGAVCVQALQPLALKGKSEVVPAYRVVSVHEPQARSGRTALVGRSAELDHLRQVYVRARRGRRCCLATVVGAAGIGKSRLVQEFLTDPVLEEALVLHAACQPYGAGLTYRPVADLIRSLPGGWGEAVTVLNAEYPGDERAVEALAAAMDLGAGDARAPGTNEISWAFRCLVEALGRTRPLVLVLDNLQWAQPALLDLITDVAGGAVGAQVLMVCLSRPDLLDARPGWAGGVGCSTSFELDPLTVDESRTLVSMLVDPAEVSGQEHHAAPALERIVHQSDGNPLHAELLLETHTSGTTHDSVPPSIRVLITAWLDGLRPAERDLLERAATISTGAFTIEEVQFLARDSPALSAPGALDEPLRRLLRTNTVERSGPKGEYRVARLLVREVIYETTPKERRATWHALLAQRLRFGLEEAARYGRQTEGDLAFHLRAAYRLLREIRPGDESLPELGMQAALALVTAGTRALRRRDLHDATTLLEQGRDLLPKHHPDHPILTVRISDAYAGLGDWARAHESLDHCPHGSGGRGRRTVEIQRRILWLRSGQPDPGPAEDAGLDEDDDLSWCRMHLLAGLRFLAAGRVGAAEASMRAALGRAQRLGDNDEEDRLLVALGELAQWSPTPVADGIALCDNLAERFQADRYLLIPVLLSRGRLAAMSGQEDHARQCVAVARRYAEDLKLPLGQAAAAEVAALIESLAGDHHRAWRILANAARDLDTAGQSAIATLLRVNEAWQLVRAGDIAVASKQAATIDPDTLPAGERIVHKLLHAYALSAASALPQALAATAAICEELDQIDDPVLVGEVLVGTAQILDVAGENEAATAVARRALAHFRRKGATRLVALTQSWLTEREVQP